MADRPSRVTTRSNRRRADPGAENEAVLILQESPTPVAAAVTRRLTLVVRLVVASPDLHLGRGGQRWLVRRSGCYFVLIHQLFEIK